MERPKVSIIVPVYKVENEIRRCVDSLINQTLKEIEIILVDDGSPDNCPVICDEYMEHDHRVKVIHKENRGLSEARNLGLYKASGDYVLFVDSDDYISKDACKNLYSNAVEDNLDIVVGDAVKIASKKKIYMRHTPISLGRIMSGAEFLKEQLNMQTMYMAACFCLYKRNFLIDNELFFKKGIYHEDEQWTPRVFLKAKKVKYSGVIFYYYTIREKSITNNNDKTKNGIDLITTCYELAEIYKKITDKELKALLNDYLAMLFLHAVHYGDLYGEQYNHLINKCFLVGKPLSVKNKVKAGLYVFNEMAYRSINRLFKSFRNAVI